MERRNRKKWIIGAIAAVVLMLGSVVTYEVISFNRDMKELGRGLGEIATGLSELGQGLSKINFSSDTTHVQVDSAATGSEGVDSVRNQD